MKHFSHFLITSILAICCAGANPTGPGWGVGGRPDPTKTGQDITRDGTARSITEEPVIPVASLSPRDAAASLAPPTIQNGIMARGGGPTLLSAPTVTSGGNEADVVTPEIQELARGLRYDPVKIFEYVHNFIKFECYFGSKKGAHLTLLEGSGNDFDQSSLLVALLRASGLSPTYEYGPCLFSYNTMAGWLGLPTNTNDLFPQWDDAEFLAAYSLPPSTPNVANLRRRAAVLEYLYPRGYFMTESFGNPTNFSIPHVWVKLDGKNISPSLKFLTIVPGQNLKPIIDYDRDELLTDAAGNQGGATWVSELEYGQISERLETYTQNFLTNIRSYDHLTAEQLVGTTFVSQESYDSLDDVTPISPDSIAAADWLPFDSWTAIPTIHMSTVNIRAGIQNPTTGAWTQTLFNEPLILPGLRGRKISLSFVGNSARIHLDDDLVASAFTIPGTQPAIDLELAVTHNHYRIEYDSDEEDWVPYLSGISDREWTTSYQKGDDYAYALVYSFGNPDRLSRVRQEKLEAYRRQGLDDDDWEVRTELLNIIGLNWYHQTWQVDEIATGLYQVDNMAVHRFGRVAQEDSFFIDVGLQLSGALHRAGDFNRRDQHAGMTMLFTSALEHGVIEQMQGQGVAAVSTVKMIYLANEADEKIYRANAGNWNTVEAALVDYPSGDIAEIEDVILNDEGVALLPENGKITLNQYTGFGYAAESDEMYYMKIGDNHGGYNTLPDTVGINELLDWIRSDSSYTKGSSDLIIPSDPLGMFKAEFVDPVDVATGAWITSEIDLTLGAGDPKGLTFTRSYNSNSRYNNSPGLGYGWTHNYDLHATRRSGVRASLGLTTSYQAAPFITALTAAADLHGNHATAKEWATAALVINWAVDQMIYKAVAITQGSSTAEFIEMPDGTFIPPAGMKLTLTEPQPGEFTLTQRHGSSTHFANGRAVSTIDPHGNTQSFTYDSGKLTEVEDAYDRKLTFTWSGTQIGSISDGTGRSIGFTYVDGDFTGVTDPEGKTSGFVYDGEHRVTATTDGMGRTVVENEYDSKSRVILQRNRGDATRAYELFYTGYTNSEVDPDGGTLSYLYDSRGRSLGNIDALGEQEVVLYDAQDRKIFFSSKDFDAVDYYYDPDHNLEEIVDQEFESMFFFYDNQIRLEELVDKRGNSTFFTYNNEHQILVTTDGEGNTTTNTYDTAGNLETREDGEGRVTTFGYDEWDQINRITFNDTKFETFINNARGDRLKATDAEGRTVDNTWNKRRQPLTTVFALGTTQEATVSMAYNDAGQLLSATDGKGHITSYTHNASDNPLTVTLPSLPAGGNTITTEYNSRDLAETVTDSLSQSAIFEYDATKRVVATIDPLNRRTEFDHDATGRLLETKDPLNRVTKQVWTPRSERERDTNGLNQHVDFTYDPNGNLTHVKNRRGHTFITQFDDANRPYSTSTPTNKTTSTIYFDDGKPQKVTEPSGQETDFVYNARGLNQSKTDSTGTISYLYDDSGALETVTEGSVATTRTYDERGRLKSYTTADDDFIQYEYDENNNLTKLTYPGGKEVDYVYNARNLLATVTDWNSRVTTYHYDRLGRLTGVENANGTEAAMSYDAAGQQLDLKESKGGTLFSYLRFGYDLAGQIKNRFRAPLMPPGMAHPTFAATYDNDNRLLTANGQTVVHDDDGNMTLGPITPTSGMVNLTFNSRNQLTAADGTSYTYDAEGRRRTLTAGTGTTRFVMDPNGSLDRLLIRHNPDQSVTYFVHGLGILYEVDESENTKTYHYDQVGSTIALTNDSGKVTGRAEYTAYGFIGRKLGEMDTPFLYNGRFGVMSDPNGLLHMRARYYSPFLMRFLNPDPIGFSGGMNWFAYADGNPISMLDPFGLAPKSNVDMGRYGALGGYGTGGAYARQEVARLALATEVALGFTPIGVFMDLYSLGDSSIQGDYQTAGISIVALLPLGDLVKGLKYADELGFANSAGNIPEPGGLNLFRAGPDGQATREASTGWREGDRMLYLPNQGSAQANWAQNSGRLREEMGNGQPIFDSYRDAATGLQIPAGTTPSSGGRFLNAERKLLESRGWQYNSTSGAYHPPSQ